MDYDLKACIEANSQVKSIKAEFATVIVFMGCFSNHYYCSELKFKY